MSDDNRLLTTRQGHPVSDNQSLRSVGERGPATLENYQFIEKITHFDRERIPERVVHARGTAAHGYFEAYGKIGEEPPRKASRAPARTRPRRRAPAAPRAPRPRARPPRPRLLRGLRQERRRAREQVHAGQGAQPDRRAHAD